MEEHKQHGSYEAPLITDLGEFGRITRGSDSVGVSDDGNGAAYTDEFPDDGRG